MKAVQPLCRLHRFYFLEDRGQRIEDRRQSADSVFCAFTVRRLRIESGVIRAEILKI